MTKRAPSFVGPIIQACTVTSNLHAVVDSLLGLDIGPFALYHFDTATNTTARYRGKDVQFRYDCATTADRMWEVSQPVDGDSMFSDFLHDHRQGGYQHIAVQPTVAFAGALKQFRARGFETLMEMIHWEQVKVAYVTNQSQVIELFDIPQGFRPPPPDQWLG